MGSRRLMDTEFALQDEESSGEGWWWWLYNNVNMLRITELCT